MNKHKLLLYICYILLFAKSFMNQHGKQTANKKHLQNNLINEDNKRGQILEREILNKLEEIQQQQKTDSTLANAFFGLALMAISISILYNNLNTPVPVIVMSVFIGIIGGIQFLKYISRLGRRTKRD